MDEKQLQAQDNGQTKNLKTPEDLSQFDRLLKKISVEATLNAEMMSHLRREKKQPRITGDNQILPVAMFFAYPTDLCKVIYTTNAMSCCIIESGSSKKAKISLGLFLGKDTPLLLVST